MRVDVNYDMIFSFGRTISLVPMALILHEPNLIVLSNHCISNRLHNSTAHLNTDPHIRQIHFTVSLCPIVTQGLEMPSEHASQTLGTFLKSSVMAYFGFRKESVEKQNSMR